MPLDLTHFDDTTLDADYLAWLVDTQSEHTQRHFGKLWEYFRNPMRPPLGPSAPTANAASRPYVQAQEMGLPARITGVRRPGLDDPQADLRRKEVVIENDIAWRVHTMVDFLFGQPVTIRSRATDPTLARVIEQAISALLDANGGLALLQEMALFGSVYGFVDIALRTPADATAPHARPASRRRGPAENDAPSARRSGLSDDHAADRTGEPSATSQTDRPGSRDADKARLKRLTARAVNAAGQLVLEPIEAPRVLPITHDTDIRRTRYWVQRFHASPARMSTHRRGSLRGLLGGSGSGDPARVEVIEILGPHWWQRYEDRQLVAEGANRLGRIPVVHVQNLALPGSYAGLGDVEPLVPLQDELNTRLSDRANRVTFQSFRMYLGKGIDDFLERPVGPGQMWTTQDPAASIEEFGSDPGSPSEDAHIDEIRQAIDKVSGVTPVAAGLLRGNVGNLTSATALRVLLSGLLARTAKKRLSYGAGIAGVVELALTWLDATGVLPTEPADRKVDVHWPSPLPEDESTSRKLQDAQIKLSLGVPADRVLAELGYDRQAAGPAE